MANLRNIYDSRRIWKIALVAISLMLVAVFLFISNRLVKDLAAQERDRMEIWANATKELATMNSEPVDSLGNPAATTDVDFLFSIIEGNRTIPVLLVDDEDNILLHRNFRLPDPVDSLMPYEISPLNMQFLEKKLKRLKGGSNSIEIRIDDETTQYLYYEDSTVLRRLAYYPYIQLAVLLIFIAVAYFALISVKRPSKTKCGWDCRRKRRTSWARPSRRSWPGHRCWSRWAWRKRLWTTWTRTYTAWP